jgi:hypothetical protein
MWRRERSACRFLEIVENPVRTAAPAVPANSIA